MLDAGAAGMLLVRNEMFMIENFISKRLKIKIIV